MELLLDADERQFTTLFLSVEKRSDQTVPILEAKLDKEPPPKKGEGEPTDLDDMAWDKFNKRQASAGVALIRLGRTERLRTLLKHSPDPSQRSYLVHRLGPLGVEPSLLIATLDRESDVSVRRALILGLGEYGEFRLSTTERGGLTKTLLGLYRDDPDPGIHGAADWLLRQWRNEDQIEKIDKELARLPLPTRGVDKGAELSQGNNRGWYINSQGQTMVIVRPHEFAMGEEASQHRVRPHVLAMEAEASPHREQMGHRFAIAAKEVTAAQFETFLKDNPRIAAKYDKKVAHAQPGR